MTANCVRIFLVGGTNPKATPLVEAKKLQTAKNADAKYWANKKDVFPTKP